MKQVYRSKNHERSTFGIVFTNPSISHLQLIATPFAFGSIYLGPVGAMVTLAISYIFGKSTLNSNAH